MPKQRKSRSSQRTTVPSTTAQSNGRANSTDVVQMTQYAQMPTETLRLLLFQRRLVQSGPRQQLIARLQANDSQDSTSPPIPSDHGLHDCFYRGAKTGNLKLREQLAVELNIWRRSAIRPTIRSATFARRYKSRTRSLSPTGPQWRTTTDSVLSGFLAVLLSARFESRNTGRRSPPAHQPQSPFYRQPSLQQLHRSHNKR